MGQSREVFYIKTKEETMSELTQEETKDFKALLEQASMVVPTHNRYRLFSHDEAQEIRTMFEIFSGYTSNGYEQGVLHKAFKEVMLDMVSNSNPLKRKKASTTVIKVIGNSKESVYSKIETDREKYAPKILEWKTKLTEKINWLITNRK
jgi:hypothetical protein